MLNGQSSGPELSAGPTRGIIETPATPRNGAAQHTMRPSAFASGSRMPAFGGGQLVPCILALALLLSQISPQQAEQQPVGFGYRVESVSNFADRRGFQALLQLNKQSDVYGPDIDELLFTVRFETEDRLHVKITDASNARWEVPPDAVPRGKESATSEESHGLAVSFTQQPFGFAVTRRSNGEVLFNSTPQVASPDVAASLREAFQSGKFETHLANDDHQASRLRAGWEQTALLRSAVSSDEGKLLFGNLVFKDQYLEISTQLPALSSSLYGFGESTRPDGIRLSPGRTYTLWNTDVFPNNTDIDLYGAFPYYLDVRADGQTHGVLLLNSNGIEATYGGSFVTLRAIGGVLDLFFFAGPTPLKVTDQYTRLVGRPAPVPYWALGFHQSRFGYRSVQELEDVVGKYNASKIPLEGIWSDIDCMDEYRDFELDPVNYPEEKMADFVDRLHANGQRYIVIVDPGIKIDDGYLTYQRGLAADIFVKNPAGENYVAQVWPFAVNFPDFFNPATQAFWTLELEEFYEKLPFDGVWIDMNEPSNFCTGPVCSARMDSSCIDPTTCCLKDCFRMTGKELVNVSKWEDPPFKLNCKGVYQPLGTNTMAMSAIHFGGALEYNTHNLFGLMEGRATHTALKQATKKRPFIVSRSTFVGSGAYVAHWTGDNYASWKDLEYSTVSILNAGMFGIPMVGADICGFNGDTWEELCNRWIQVGAFYPFSRNHADTLTIHQELYLWDSVASNARKVLNLRYRLLPYLYTSAFQAHQTGSPIARPLFFEFPGDTTAQTISSQFLLGRGVLVSPVVTAGADSVRAYIPKGTWYDLFDTSQVLQEETGSFHILPAPIDVINVHIRDGTIIPLQDPAKTTTSARQTPFSLLIAFSLLEADPRPFSIPAQATIQDTATGDLFLDNDESVEMTVESGKSTFITFEANRHISEDGTTTGIIKSSVTAPEFALLKKFRLQKLTVLGVEPSSGIRVKVFTNRRTATASAFRVDFRRDMLRGSRMEISDLNLLLGQEFEVQWESTNSSPAGSAQA